LHPFHDKNPIPLKARLTGSDDFQISEIVSNPGQPVVARLVPKNDTWDCSSKLWILLDVQNDGRDEVLVRAEVTSEKKRGWGQNKGAVVVPSGEMRTLPVLIIRGMIEGRSESLQKIFNTMRGYPGGHQQTGWRQIDASALNKIKLEFFTDASRVECIVSNLRAATNFELPPDTELKSKYSPATDPFGQNCNANWEFKIKAEDDFAKRLASEKVWLDKFEVLEKRSRYGGWTGGERFPATGHFRTEETGGKWWLIDPDGWPFWSIGATGFNLKLGQTNTPGIGSWNPRKLNLKRKYGQSWEKTYADFTHRRLRAWGMNTLGNWSTPDFYLMKRTPYTVAVHFKRPSMHDPNPKAHSWLPDVFHPDFRKNTFAAVARFEKEAIDPWCIGFFIDNELPFQQPGAPASKALLSPKACVSRQEFIGRLKKKYRTLEKLNDAWNTECRDWDSLIIEKDKHSEERNADVLEFSAAWYHEYFKVCRDAMRKHAPEKLYLGSRINHWKNHAAINICAEYTDVVSINLYDYTPDVFQPPDGFNAPVMIGEFHFGTITERGVWGGGLCVGMDIEHAAELFQYYTAEAVKNPLIVGAHWFKFSDQPLTGRRDGENYRIGFVDGADTPYPEMVKACRNISESMYVLRQKIFKTQRVEL
jgi:hypothetical protein